MGIPWDDVVLVEHGKNPDDPTVVTVNCPDKAGLGCDLCRIILECRLYVTRGDVTKVLCELGLTIQQVKVMTTPDGKALDLFFITDGVDLLHKKERRDGTCEHLSSVLGEYFISCEIQLAGPEYECQQRFSSLPLPVAEELFSCELSDKGTYSEALGDNNRKVKKATITVDNLTSPSHTLLQIQCMDQKCLIYDILRTSKDCDIQISYERVSSSVKGY